MSDTIWLLRRRGSPDDDLPCTLGTVVFNRQELCKTAELPWRDNHHDLSCIRAGLYLVEPHPINDRKLRLSNAPGRDDLAGRTEINLETGNDPAGLRISKGKPQSKGCIFPGMEFVEPEMDGVIDSGTAMDEVLEAAKRCWASGRLFLRVRWAIL